MLLSSSIRRLFSFSSSPQQCSSALPRLLLPFRSISTSSCPPLPIVYSNEYSIDWDDSHRFIMSKFSLLKQQLIEQGIIRHESELIQPDFDMLSTLEKAMLVHDASYVQRFFTGNLSKEEMKRIGLPWSSDLPRRMLLEVAGTETAARYALKHGLACNTAGGTHHAHRDFGSGFTVFNDLAIASSVLLSEGAASRIMIIDLDVHQGDGTAAIFEHDRRVFTFSMHGEKNFPLKKENSSFDVPLPDGTDDEHYLEQLEHHLPRLLGYFEPDFVFYDAGVDTHKNDALGRLSMSNAGLLRRDLFVLRYLRHNNIPVATVIGGGYAKDHLEVAVRHSIVFNAAKTVWEEMGHGRLTPNLVF
uniref:Histone deacetylase domain-containing protein n=1 Tax=Palpitomonas bilix TaxID=652834 RepID=A0A7S3G466_9EUKA|mmetsp:Transcript_2419/g.5024  ORF Transcript_2419/g.5024 Transcript_2419/m.5024 type:complete len:358 (+) Transcript_2419:285-1358(+)